LPPLAKSCGDIVPLLVSAIRAVSSNRERGGCQGRGADQDNGRRPSEKLCGV